MSSNLDLTEAIEAAADALCDVIDAGIQPCLAHGQIHRDHNGRRFCDASRADVSGLVQAAAPIIARQVAERIADLINAAADPLMSCNAYWNGYIDGMRISAWIARRVGSDG